MKLKSLFRLLPERLRLHLIRRMVEPPTSTEGLVYKLATTKHELESAYQLLHNAYVGQKLMAPDPSGLRYSIYFALPYTSVIVAKDGDEVVGTVSLIKDSPLGFPSDKDYRLENNYYRKLGRQILEVSALAVHPNYRLKGHSISLHLMKYLYQYSQEHMKADMLCATVHPRAVDFYKALFAFKQNGKIVEYKFVNKALAAHITLDLSGDHVEEIEHLYDQYPARNNIYKFCTAKDKSGHITFPDRDGGFTIHPVMTPEYLSYFFVEKTGLHKKVTPHELDLVRSSYEQYFDLYTLVPELYSDNIAPRNHFRYLTAINATYRSGNLAVMGKILDLSSGGVFFASSAGIPNNLAGELQFSIADRKFKISCVSQWKNQVQAMRYPLGVGIAFDHEVPELKQIFGNIYLNKPADITAASKKIAS